MQQSAKVTIFYTAVQMNWKGLARQRWWIFWRVESSTKQI